MDRQVRCKAGAIAKARDSSGKQIVFSLLAEISDKHDAQREIQQPKAYHTKIDNVIV